MSKDLLDSKDGMLRFLARFQLNTEEKRLLRNRQGDLHHVVEGRLALLGRGDSSSDQ